MSLLFGDKNLRFVFLMGVAIFVVTGFLWEPVTGTSGSLAYSAINTDTASVYNSNAAALREIDWGILTPTIISHITQGYGKTKFAAQHDLLNSWHNGIDINAKLGAPIHSESKGRVVFVGDQDKYCRNKGYGKFVMIKNANDNHTLLYAHLSKISVAEGDNIDQGAIIGFVGTTGLATGPHLHFSVFKTNLMKIGVEASCGPRPEGGEMNPLNYLR